MPGPSNVETHVLRPTPHGTGSQLAGWTVIDNVYQGRINPYFNPFLFLSARILQDPRPYRFIVFRVIYYIIYLRLLGGRDEGPGGREGGGGFPRAIIPPGRY